MNIYIIKYKDLYFQKYNYKKLKWTENFKNCRIYTNSGTAKGINTQLRKKFNIDSKVIQLKMVKENELE
jgi:hypothetical protein